MVGIKGRSGRRKNPNKALAEAWDQAALQFPSLVDKYMNLAKTTNNVQLFMYICDRIMGKPKQQIDSKVQALIASITPDTYAVLQETRKEIGLEEKKLLVSQEMIRPDINDDKPS